LRIFKRWLLFLLVSLLPCAAHARAAAPVWEMLAEVQVAGESIYLSDLLPTLTPAEIRDPAGKISLGAAPPPGGTITLSAERIAGFLSRAAREEIVIPPAVVVHRSGRPLTRDEIVVALRSALRSNRLPGANTMEPEDVHYSAPVQVSAVDAQLEVRRIDFDPALKQARFLLASAADRRSLPFLVTASLRPDPSETPASTAQIFAKNLASDYRGTRSTEVSLGEIPLVEPKKLARLHVSSASMQMFLDVVPLEKGALHETVRVKVLGNGRVLRGQVVAPGQLEAQF
jgi:hypothetical protein